jgi:putative FmdB family regulatory protein
MLLDSRLASSANYPHLPANTKFPKHARFPLDRVTSVSFDYNSFPEERMPDYPYICLNCRKRFEIFMTYSEYGAKPVHCPHCQSERVQRRIGRIRFARSEESRLENLADPSSLAGLEDDPKALGRMMRQMGSEMGEDMGPEFDEVIDRLEAGQSPEEIEESVPDLGGSGGADNLDF